MPIHLLHAFLFFSQSSHFSLPFRSWPAFLAEYFLGLMPVIQYWSLKLQLYM
jgi:hypothetical protein